MKIVSISTNEYYRYIPMKGLDSVEEALETFAGGMTRGSRDTEKQQIHDINQSQGGLASAFYLVASRQIADRTDSFVQQRIMTDARKALKRHDKWSADFDYDGMGTSFFKTSVDIEVLDRDSDMFALGLNAAYVGDKPEIGLAEFLGIPRALIWASVEIETEPIEGDRFEFDFEPLLRKMDRVIGSNRLLGTHVATAMMTVGLFDKPKFMLWGGSHCVATLMPGAVDRRFDHSNRRIGTDQPIDTWSAEGSVVRGRLRDSYEEEGKKAAPTIVIDVRSVHTDSMGSGLPIWDPTEKTKVLEFRDDLAAALRS